MKQKMQQNYSMHISILLSEHCSKSHATHNKLLWR